MDRIVFIDRKAKIRSLNNYEQSHTLGLRLLSYLQSDLDILLLVESQYGCNKLLLNLQKASRVKQVSYQVEESEGNLLVSTNESDEREEDEVDDENSETENVIENMDETIVNNDEIILDMLSMERNYVLVQLNVIGGPREKQMPQRLLERNDV